MMTAVDMRARTIAPGFWKNPELARCDAHARLMFAALWGLADRAGRLEDRPDKIRAEAFPFEPQVEADALLWQLHAQGLALRYVALGHELIEMPGFERFQHPCPRERLSLWPSVQDPGSTLRVPPSGIPTIHNEVVKVGLSTVYCLLSTDLPPPGGGGGSAAPRKSALKEKTESGNPKNGNPEIGNHPARVAASCPHELIRQLWSETLPTLPAPTLPWNGTSAKYLRARWRAQALYGKWDNVGEGLAWFKALFGYVARSRFLTGRTGPRRQHETPFEITLEWLVKLEHWIAVQQGQYHDKGEGNTR